MYKLLKKNPSGGFTLLGAIIASAILGVVALGFSQLVRAGLQGKETVNQSMEFETLKVEMMNYFMKSRYECKDSFKSASGNNAKFGLSNPSDPSSLITTEQVEELYQQIGAHTKLLAKVGKKYGKIEVSEINLAYQLADDGSPIIEEDTPNSGQNTHHVELTISAKKSGLAIGNSMTNKNTPIKLVLVTDTTDHRIVDCNPNPPIASLASGATNLAQMIQLECSTHIKHNATFHQCPAGKTFMSGWAECEDRMHGSYYNNSTNTFYAGCDDDDPAKITLRCCNS